MCPWPTEYGEADSAPLMTLIVYGRRTRLTEGRSTSFPFGVPFVSSQLPHRQQEDATDHELYPDPSSQVT